MFTLLKKEISSFLNSLIGYTVIIVFLVTISLFLWIFENDFNIFDAGYAALDPLFLITPWMYLFLIPAVTMRLFSEERKTGTMELLFTKPLTEMQVIAAKYFASLVIVIFSLLPTLIYYFCIWMLGAPRGNMDTGGVMGSYIGLVFLGGGFISIGLFASALTDNQVIAFITAMFLCLVCFTGFESLSSMLGSGKVSEIIYQLGINAHYKSMSRGVIDTRDVVYFISLSVVFMWAARLVLESRKW